MLKAFKYRIYPNKDQEDLINKTFGCTRFIYNYFLKMKEDLYQKEKKFLSKTDCNNYCNQVLKKEFPWLKDPDKFALTKSIYNLDNAYKRFFKLKTGYPRFKSKHSNYQSYSTNFTNNNIKIENNLIKLPKLKWIKVKPHRSFKGKIKSATISKVPSGKYFVSVLVETEHKVLPTNNNSIGIDLGIKDLIITSNGSKYKNLKTLYKYEKQLKFQQKKLSKKKKGSNNRNKQRIKVVKIHEKITNTRKDYLHKVSDEIIKENQIIITEDLNVKGMVKNHKLAKAIQDSSWSELCRQLEYKSRWNKRIYHKVDRFFPSSQLCNNCGYKNKDTKDLSVRSWKCIKCNSKHDRDINAANNILGQGLSDLKLVETEVTKSTKQEATDFSRDVVHMTGLNNVDFITSNYFLLKKEDL